MAVMYRYTNNFVRVAAVPLVRPHFRNLIEGFEKSGKYLK